MKIDLKDVTFLILVRLDSVERIENLLITTNYITRNFHTNIIVLEVAQYKNKILESLLNKSIVYQFIEDKDPILFKTKYFNILTKQCSTPIIGIWDADIIAKKTAIYECIVKIRTNESDVSLPYDGRCLDVPKVIRSVFIKRRDIQVLFKNKPKMALLYDRLLVGGAVFVNREKYILSGMENLDHYGWGNDDFDRFYRFQLLDYRIYKANAYLFHLSHPRSTNSKYRSLLQMKKSASELLKLKSLSPNEFLSRKPSRLI